MAVTDCWKSSSCCLFKIEHGQNLISRTRGSSRHLENIPTENNENFTKKRGISKYFAIQLLA